jgi:hypothetical protein
MTMNAFMIQQLYQQGVQCAQAGWAYENMGHSMAAGRSYQQALGALEACGQLPGAVPVDRFYWIGACQLRLGWLTYMAGNLPWAQDWFQLAQQNLLQACQGDPKNPTYRGMLGEVTKVQDKKSGGAFLGLLKRGLGMLPGLVENLAAKKDENSGGGGWLQNLLKLGKSSGDTSGALVNCNFTANGTDCLSGAWSSAGDWSLSY